MAAGRVPGSTYRLQLTPAFGFAEAADAAEYLADLGVSHVYLSPVLEAVPGSRHGYDVTDHSRIRAELGGDEGFRAMVKRMHALGLGIVLDIVPNHMAVPANLALNRQLWSVLRHGRESSHANWFDIDWAAQDDRMLLPILGGPLDDCLADLRVEDGGGPDGEPVLRYFDHVLPLREGTARLPMRDRLESQHYRLTWWRDAETELNWRRFFDVTSLIGVRVEDPDVFGITHEVILGLVADGLVDGLRVDHPDGLADPRGYLRRLAAATGGAWVVAEKILEEGETLPPDWPCAGTTGYDALRIIDGLFLDPRGGDALTAVYARFGRQAGDDSAALRFADVATPAKREIATATLHAEVARLVRLLGDVCPDAAPDEVLLVLTEMLASFPVYRAYVQPGEFPSAAARAAIRVAADGARLRLPRRLHGLAADIGAAVLGLRPADRAAELVVRFQQTTGPVLAKGVEDTACYRWSRLIALNEVGGDPGRFGVSPREFHAAVAHLAVAWPTTMTTLSTHDTKREEDIRARLAVLAEMPEQWGQRAGEWHERSVALFSPGGTDFPREGPAPRVEGSRPSPASGAPAPHPPSPSSMPPGPRTPVGMSDGKATASDRQRFSGDSGTGVDPDTEYLVWQTLVGAWPISGDRLAGYLTKAIREAKRWTSWTDIDPEYEAAVLGLGARALDDPELTASIEEFVASIADDALANSLGAKLVQLTMVGVPDIYQGCELSGFSLVDPDNRRAVDFARRRSMLADLDEAGLDGAGLDGAGLDGVSPDGVGPDGVSLDGAGLDLGSGERPDPVAALVARLQAAKLLVTSRTLRLRRARPEWFAGDYAPLTAIGQAADHVVAFARAGQAITVATRLPAGLRGRGGWEQTALELPGGAWTDLLSGAVHDGGTVPVAELTRRLPVALLVREAPPGQKARLAGKEQEAW